MNKGHKAPGKKPFVTQALTEIPLLDQSNTSECSEEHSEILTTMGFITFTPHSILFCFNSFQELRKSPCLSAHPAVPTAATTKLHKCSHYARKSYLLHRSPRVCNNNTPSNIQHFYSSTFRNFAKRWSSITQRTPTSMSTFQLHTVTLQTCQPTQQQRCSHLPSSAISSPS